MRPGKRSESTGTSGDGMRVWSGRQNNAEKSHRHGNSVETTYKTSKMRSRLGHKPRPLHYFTTGCNTAHASCTRDALFAADCGHTCFWQLEQMLMSREDPFPGRRPASLLHFHTSQRLQIWIQSDFTSRWKTAAFWCLIALRVHLHGNN